MGAEASVPRPEAPAVPGTTNQRDLAEGPGVGGTEQTPVRAAPRHLQPDCLGNWETHK